MRTQAFCSKTSEPFGGIELNVDAKVAETKGAVKVPCDRPQG
jgi:hypothetical protein